MNATSLPALSGETMDTVVNLREFVDSVMESRWLVAGTTLAVLTFGIFIGWCMTPVYETDALVQVENEKSVLPGQDELFRLLAAGASRGATEMEIISSRSVINRVVEEQLLDISAAPRYFPIIGAALARRHDATRGLAEPFLGMDKYASGGERIRVTRLEVPPELEGESLVLIAGTNPAYALIYEDKLLLNGEVGKPAAAKAGALPVEMFVSELEARPGTKFRVVKRPFDETVRSLQKALRITEKGRQTGILQLTLEGRDPDRVAAVINAIVNAYLRQNVERQSEEAQRMLEFLNEQLPRLKTEVDTSEAALKEYKARTGAAVDVSVKGQELLTRVTDVEKEITALELQRSELKQRFTEQHPLVATLNEKLGKLTRQRGELEEGLKRLPNTEWQSLRLVRDVTVANELYVLLLNRAQELKVAKAGTIGNVRALDTGTVPQKPARPNMLLVALGSLLGGLVAGVALVFARRALRRTLEDPAELEQQLGLAVYATVPHSAQQSTLGRTLKRRQRGNGVKLLARDYPQDSAVESLRSLRTSLQFALSDSGNGVVAIHGATPMVGKSFVATNLAFLCADSGKRVLLIDGDMRKGHIHKALGLPRSPGLSEVLAGQCNLEQVTQVFEADRISIITTGVLPPNPAELLLGSRFSALVKLASERYDLVLIDSPPTLNLADSLPIGKVAGTNLIVLRGGVSTMGDVQVALQRMQQNRIRIHGAIFNDLSAIVARYRHGGYYAYRYGKS